MSARPANALLALATVVGTLAAAEVVARYGAPPLLPLAEFSRQHCWQRSGLLGHENIPGCRCRTAEAEVRINSIGLRGPELRSPGAVRILALGDSCTFGYRVAENETYPARLQELLDARYGPGRYEVLNAGVEGHASLQGLVYLRERGLALRPAIVIFGYGFNDKLHQGRDAAWIPLQRRLLPFFLFSDWLSERSKLWLWIVSRQPQRDAESTRPWRVPPDEFETNVREIARLARESGATPIAISFALTQQPPYDDALRNAATAVDLPVVEFHGSYIPNDVVHPSALGYGQLAAILLERLVALGLVS
jgi:lysophospholipase L1-like esterase